MTWGRAFLRCRTKSGRRRLFRLWLEEERPELLHALLKLTLEAIDRIIDVARSRAPRSRPPRGTEGGSAVASWVQSRPTQA